MMENAKKVLKNTTDPMEKLRMQALSRGAAGIKELGRMFRIIDDDGSRKLDFNEFSKGLHDYGTNLSKDEVKLPMSQARQNLIMQAFKKLDKNGSGVITVDDLKGVYCVSRNPKFLNGEATEDELLRNFLATFEIGGHVDGTITVDEFVNYYAGVSASIDQDVYFDLMMRNSWKL